MEFKGTRGNWNRYTASVPSIERPTRHSVYAGTQRIALCYDLFESDKSKNVKDQEAEYNALLISKAPEILKELVNEVEILKAMGLGDTERCKRKERLIKEATEL